MAKAITEINKSTLNKIDAEVQAAMQKIAEKHGLELKRGNVRYSDADFRYTGLTFAVKGEVEGTSKKDAEAFRAYCRFEGISEKALGFTFRDGKDTLTIAGWNPKKPKNCIILRAEGQSKGYVAPVGYIKRFLPKELLTA